VKNMFPLSIRKVLENTGGMALAMLCCALMIGCSTAVTPPLNPRNPQVIYLCDCGIHSSLLLPVGNGTYVEFLYGDWNWAALGHHGPQDALGALLFSQQSTLGRRFLKPPGGDAMPQPVDRPFAETRVIVNGDGCWEVVRKLMARWEQHRATATLIETDLSYVKDDEPYSWTHDCNALTADCLRAMGCKVDGSPILSNFRVVDPAP